MNILVVGVLVLLLVGVLCWAIHYAGAPYLPDPVVKVAIALIVIFAVVYLIHRFGGISL